MTVTVDTAVIGLLITGVSVAIGVLWRVLKFTKAVEDKATKADLQLINEELMELQHKFESVKESINQKADKSSIELLKQDLEFVRKMMVTKEDLLKLERTIIELMSKP